MAERAVFASMVGVLVFANFGKSENAAGAWLAVYSAKWYITGVFAVAFAVILILWFKVKWWKILIVAVPTVILALLWPGIPMLAFGAAIIGLSSILSTNKGEAGEWFTSSWGFAKQILPLLLFGVLVAGFSAGQAGAGRRTAGRLDRIGGRRKFAGFKSLRIGSRCVYVLRDAYGSADIARPDRFGHGQRPGPGAAAGWARTVAAEHAGYKKRDGTKKTLVYILLVIIMATISGIIFGAFFLTGLPRDAALLKSN